MDRKLKPRLFDIYNYYFYASKFSCCEKKSVQAKVIPTPVKTQRPQTTVSILNTNTSTVVPMKTTKIIADRKPSSSNDLATKVKPARR